MTWFFIFRFIIEYKAAGGNDLFTDSYLDVAAAPHWSVSSQLLTWAVVAAVWAHQESVLYLLFGMLGAESAGLLLVPSKTLLDPATTIPAAYAPVSAVGCLAVAALCDPSRDFKLWLHVLHVCVALPSVVARLWPSQPRLPAAPIYAGLAILCAAIHTWDRNAGRAQGAGAWVWPETDCQVSISIDLAICSALTLYTAWRCSGNSLSATAFATVALPILSPAGVLAAVLCATTVGKGHSTWVTGLQRRTAERLTAKAEAQRPQRGSKSGLVWRNLGLWSAGSADKGSQTSAARAYPDACTALAQKLGEAILEPGDGVLACGCGEGAELGFFRDAFKLRHITGVDVDAASAERFRGLLSGGSDLKTRLLCMDACDIAERLPRGLYNKVLALDSAYHFQDKQRWMNGAANLLPPGGRIGLTDLVWTGPGDTPPLWQRAALRAMGVQQIWSRARYVRALESAGFRSVDIRSVNSGGAVLGKWFPNALVSRIDYALVTASLPPAADAKTRRKIKSKKRMRVAVVGSGLAGLTAAHTLAPHADVTLFEAKSTGGMSGDACPLHGQTVDIPLRIIIRGFHNYVGDLAGGLGVRMQPNESISACIVPRERKARMPRRGAVDAKDAKTAAVAGRGGGTGSSNSFGCSYRELKELYEIVEAMYRGGGAVDSRETFGEWVARQQPQTDGQGDKNVQSTPAAQLDAAWKSPMLRLLVVQLSWMLSCTYEQVIEYPAQVVLGYVKDLTETISTSGKNWTYRVAPSVRALENALAYGCEVRLESPVMGLGPGLVIDGVKYDRVIIATEACAVPRVMNERICPSVFSRVRYQASRIVIHEDASLMPPKRADWKAFNVSHSGDSDMCMITCWINAYYPDHSFPRDVFQTWNPFHEPKAEKIIKSVDLRRVVHSRETPALVAEIRRAQGKHGIYFAGAYTEYGMGLLEQAALSGKQAAEKLLAEAKV